MTRIGVISDTHGLLRPQALEALKGSELILHAGDVGDPDILTTLEEVAPLVVVRGNVDRGEWTRGVPDTQMVEVEGALLYLLHDLGTLDLSPQGAGISVVIFGHSHQPELREDRGVIYFNPGSAGPRRFDYPVTVGFIQAEDGRCAPEVVELTI